MDRFPKLHGVHWGISLLLNWAIYSRLVRFLCRSIEDSGDHLNWLYRVLN